MKVFLFCIGLLLFSHFSLGAVIFTCAPSARETVVQVGNEGNTVSVRVVNQRGYESMAQFEGPVALQGLPLMKLQFEELKSIGNEIIFSWDKSACSVDKAGAIVNCDGRASSTVAGIVGYSLSTTEIAEKVRGEEYFKRKYRLVVEKEGTTFFISLNFYKQHCF